MNTSTGLLFNKLLTTTWATLNKRSINYDNKELVNSFLMLYNGWYSNKF